MNDGNLNASASAYNASIDVTFGSIYDVDKGLSAAIIASNYDNTQTYSVGDYVVYNRKLYKCITAIDTPEEFDNEKWEQVKLADEVETLSGELVNKADKADTYNKTETDNVVAEAISNLPEVMAGQGISVDDVGDNKQINNTAGIYTVKSTNTTSNTQGEWIGNIDIPDLYNGLTIRYLVTRHTNISGNNNCMLNLTFSDGTESEFIDIMFDKNTFVKNEFQPDDVITLTYFDPAHSPTNDYVWLVQKPTVVQETTNENKALPVLLSETPSDVLKTSNCGAKKNNSFKYNPATGTLDVPNLNASNTYNKTEVDSALDDKANTSDVYSKSETDNLLSYKADFADVYPRNALNLMLNAKADKVTTYTKAEVDEIVNNLLPTETASGAIANFDTDLALPLKSYKASIVAQGGGGTPSTPIPISGFSSANVVHTGKNLMPRLDSTVTSRSVTFTPQADGKIVINGTATGGVATCDVGRDILVLPAGTYYVNPTTSPYTITVFQVVGGTASVLKSGGDIFTISGDTSVFVRIGVASGTTASNVSLALQLEKGSTATAYEPYTGTTKAIDFGQTIYGGTITIE